MNKFFLFAIFIFLSSVVKASQLVVPIDNNQQLSGVNQQPSNIVEKEVDYNFMKENLFNYSINQKVKNKSILFDANQMNKLDKVMGSLFLGEVIDKDEIFEVQEEEVDDSKESVTSRSMKFYLDSILYSDKNNWIVWVNGKSYNQKTKGNKEFEIINVTKNRIILNWVTGYNTFVYVLKQAVLNDNYPKNVDIKIIDDIADVTFTLEVNQTFQLSKEVVILEGKS